MSGSLGVRYYTPNQFEVDITGIPIINGQLFSYETNSSTPLATWSNPGLTVANTNPVVADANGRFGNVWLTQATAYKLVLYGANPDPDTPSTPSDPQGVQIWSADPCGPAASGAAQSATGIIGEIRTFAGPAASVPLLWALCFGQAISRTTYAALFSVIGTTFGAGDASTTFNLPDLRGRVTAGLDNMGGVAASRMTAGVCGVAGGTLGGVGGNQHAQQDAATAATAVTIVDPGHIHTLAGSVIGATTGTVGSTAGLTAGGLQYYNNPTVASSATGVTATAVTTITSANTGTSQNVQPVAMVNKIIYLGA